MKCTISVDDRPVAIVTTETHDFFIEKNTEMINVRVNPVGERHRWVPIAECGELDQGDYVVLCSNDSSVIAFRHAFYCEWEVYENEGTYKPNVTHVLNPHLGPIPDAPESEEK